MSFSSLQNLQPNLISWQSMLPHNLVLDNLVLEAAVVTCLELTALHPNLSQAFWSVVWAAALKTPVSHPGLSMQEQLAARYGSSEVHYCFLLQPKCFQAVNWWWDSSHCLGGAGWRRSRFFEINFLTDKACICKSLPKINDAFQVFHHSENACLNFRDLNNQEKKYLFVITIIRIYTMTHTLYMHILWNFHYLFITYSYSVTEIIKFSSLWNQCEWVRWTLLLLFCI